MWDVLECVHMKEVVVGLEGGEGLKSSVGEGERSAHTWVHMTACTFVLRTARGISVRHFPLFVTTV